jgi:hypothetical protein
MTEPAVQPWNVLAPQATKPPPAPEPSETWRFSGGSAWIYYGAGNTRLANPVIISDGFNSGPSDLDMIWDGMERGDFPFVTELRDRGSDLIILGYKERSASILANAEVAIECIMRALGERRGNTPLAVGGFSMGGLVTRYALAKLEFQRVDHQTGVYFSYDSPHRGAWIPISLQALAHYLRAAAPAMSRQINSPAARQLLWRHIAEVNERPAQDPMRAEFLAALDRVGGWPLRPLKLGVANGSGDGAGTGVPPGVEALKCTGMLHPFRTTTLYTQASGEDQLVAQLKFVTAAQPTLVRTSGLPELDGAPGGMLESFGIACDELARYGATESAYRWVCFVPAVSAVAIRDLDTQDDLYADINALPPDESELDEFRCAADNEPHSQMTEELGGWLLDRLPK